MGNVYGREWRYAVEERNVAEMAGRENESSEETMWIMSAIPSRSNNLGLNNYTKSFA